MGPLIVRCVWCLQTHPVTSTPGQRPALPISRLPFQRRVLGEEKPLHGWEISRFVLLPDVTGDTYTRPFRMCRDYSAHHFWVYI